MIKDQVIVIDNFYDNPDTLYDLIISSETEDSSGGNYSGVMSKESFFTDNHVKIFQKITGDVLKSSTVLNGRFRFSLKDDSGKQHIHFDPGQNSVWAGVCYLQKPVHYEVNNPYGTCMWKHKRTQLTSIPLTQEGIEKYGWNGVEDLCNFLNTEGLDESLWEKTLEVPYRYNRLVLFRPWMFHSPGRNFGTDKTNCRIIQTFFLAL